MIKLLVMYPWPGDPDSFKKHYLARHLPLCRAIPHTLNIRYAFQPETLEGTRGHWFCIYEAEYADRKMLNAAKATPEAERAAADVANYSPEPPLVLIYELNPA